jgi:hypothetical protein
MQKQPSATSGSCYPTSLKPRTHAVSSIEAAKQEQFAIVISVHHANGDSEDHYEIMTSLRCGAFTSSPMLLIGYIDQ